MKKIFRTIIQSLKMEPNRSSTDHSPPGSCFSSAADRNKDPILQTLKKYLPQYIQVSWPRADGVYRCLEISSGSGQHVVHFANEFQPVTFQPSELDGSLFNSIRAYAKRADNVRPPVCIDVREPFTSWPAKDFIFESSLDFIININMLHISPFSCAEGLFANAGQILRKNGLLFTYGPYGFHGKITPASNVRFDASLRSQDAEWGIRDVDVLVPLATKAGLRLVETIAMPANNHVLIWKREECNSTAV